MPGRSSVAGATRYGFNGKEEDPETGWTDFGARMYDPRKSRWDARDPLEAKYPGMTTYGFVLGSPIRAIDVDGQDTYVYNVDGGLLYWAHDNLPNQVHFISEASYYDILNKCSVSKCTQDDFSRAIRNNSEYYIGKNTATKMHSEQFESTYERLEHGGYLFLAPGSKELDVYDDPKVRYADDEIHPANLSAGKPNPKLSFHTHPTTCYTESPNVSDPFGPETKIDFVFTISLTPSGADFGNHDTYFGSKLLKPLATSNATIANDSGVLIYTPYSAQCANGKLSDTVRTFSYDWFGATGTTGAVYTTQNEDRTYENPR